MSRWGSPAAPGLGAAPAVLAAPTRRQADERLQPAAPRGAWSAAAVPEHPLGRAREQAGDQGLVDAVTRSSTTPPSLASIRDISGPRTRSRSRGSVGSRSVPQARRRRQPEGEVADPLARLTQRPGLGHRRRHERLLGLHAGPRSQPGGRPVPGILVELDRPAAGFVLRTGQPGPAVAAATRWCSVARSRAAAGLRAPGRRRPAAGGLRLQRGDGTPDLEGQVQVHPVGRHPASVVQRGLAHVVGRRDVQRCGQGCEVARFGGPEAPGVEGGKHPGRLPKERTAGALHIGSPWSLKAGTTTATYSCWGCSPSGAGPPSVSRPRGETSRAIVVPPPGCGPTGGTPRGRARPARCR